MSLSAEPAGGVLSALSSELGEPANAEAGIHGVLKNTDYWFNRELSQLEQDAAAKAELHARAGLPRQDIEAGEELPIETTLRSRAVELYIQWAERVRRKAQDEIQQACITAADALAQMRYTLAQHQVTVRDIAGLRSKLQQAQAPAASPVETTMKYEGLLGRGKYLILLACLVAVEWIANVPVFSELFPKEAGADARWGDVVAHAEKFESFSGLYTLAERILVYPEISLLALGVLALLMVLCHFAGTSVRKLIVFRPKEGPSVVPELHSHRRQAWLPFLLGLAGVSLVLAFLFSARGAIKPVALARQAQTEQLIANLEKGSLAAKAQNDFSKMEAAERELGDARSVLDEQTQGVAYASSISALNFPILLLNLTLVIVASAAAYMESEATVRETRADAPQASDLEEKLSALRKQALREKEIMRGLATVFESNAAKARYLEQSSPLRDWSAKAKRLDAVIPLFRAENARVRGLDVQNIRPFQRYQALELPPIEEIVSMRACSELAQWELEFEQLSRETAASRKVSEHTMERNSL